MYGISDLKEKILLTDTHVQCPVKNCDLTVEKQKKVFRRLDKFKCRKHSIYISPTTFEYENETDNMLWTDNNDMHLFRQIKNVKRESRISRDNSEDAVTWNVFRYLEKKNLLSNLLSAITRKTISSRELILWSFSPNENSQWSWLNKARIEFGESIARGSEPDIIVLTDNSLFFIEAKFLAGNETSPSDKNNSKKYVTGSENWYNRVFTNSFTDVAITSEKYELLRFWLLGTWIAEQLRIDFYLFNLVLEERETEIEGLFGKHIIQTNQKIFKRITWEEIYAFIVRESHTDGDTSKIIQFFKNKTQGFNNNYQLMKAFKL